MRLNTATPQVPWPLRQVLVASLLAMALWQVHLLAAAEPPRVAAEYDLKAAFLFNLAKFIRWPAAKFEHEDSPLVIGIRGDEALDRFSRLLGEKAIDQHKIQIKAIAQIEELRSCHVIFLSRAEKDDLAQWVAAGNSASALTVGETTDFLQQGGMIQFALASGELRLEINEQCTRQAGINITANALATLVNKGIAKVRSF